MRIGIVQPYKYQSNTFKMYNTNHSSQSFTSDYQGDLVQELAEKYQHVKNPYPLLVEELGSMGAILCAWDIIAEIEKMNKARQNTKDGIRTTQGRIKVLDTMLETQKKQTKKLLNDIEEAERISALDKIKLSRILNTRKRKSKVCSELNKSYIALHKMEEKIYPNAIMIIGLNDKSEQLDILKYLQDNSNENMLRRMSFDTVPVQTVNKEVIKHASKIRESGKHGILFIDKFNKYTVPTERNESIINKLKGFLCNCSANYNSTILVFENHPEKLDENIIGGHRFGVKIDVSDIKGERLTAFEEKYNGYTMYYDGEQNSSVDLYPANLGADKKVMWIDSNDSNKIKTVIDRIPEITQTELFNDIEYIQIPEPDSFDEIGGFRPIKSYTADGKRIYQMSLYY